VLKHVGKAALALRVVGRAGVDEGVEAEDGGLVALAEHEGEAVRKDFDSGGLIKMGQAGLPVLSACCSAGEAQNQNGRQNACLHERTSKSSSQKKLTGL